MEEKTPLEIEAEALSANLTALIGLQSDRKFLQMSDMEQMIINLQVPIMSAYLEVLKTRINIQKR